MKTSSPRQLELDYSGTEPLSGDQRFNLSPKPSDIPGGDAPSTLSAPLGFPDFSAYGEVYAVTSRLAGRINAANVSEDEHKSLLRDQQVLLDKKLDGTITRKDENRLEYIRWSLDRIEDAKFGQELDVLDDYVNRYEKFLKEIGNFEERLRQQLPKKRK